MIITNTTNFVMSTLTSGRCIPVEFLRRSSRLQKPVDPSCDKKLSKTNIVVEHPIQEKVPKKRLKKSDQKIAIQLEKQNGGSTKIDIKQDDSLGSFVDEHGKVASSQSPQPEGFIEVNVGELDLERTLLGGQSFRWTKKDSDTTSLSNVQQQPIFTGIILNHALQLWRVSSDRIAFKRLNKESQSFKISVTKAMLEDYFQLKYNLKDLYQEWSSKDQHLSGCCQQYKGFRILRQDPVENLFSFICATNNNIKRISQMVDKMCKRFGNILESNDRDKQSIYDSYHSFPSVERLADEDVFQCLRYELGFGYRAKFITETANELLRLSKDNSQPPRDYLLSLRQLPYKDTCKQLMKFQGIGRKVADCICLMSMDHLNSVPTDCHIYKIVCRHYLPKLPQERKTLTESVHDMIGDYFNTLHGPLAGWSTSVLFIAELRHLKQVEEESNKKKTTKKAKTKK